MPELPKGLELLEQPETRPMYMIAGWRQWADAGTVSSNLPEYLVQETGARQIGSMDSGGFYMFQIPGTHDLVRPVVRFEDGYPVSLETPSNDLYYTESNERGVVIFIGDEPQMDIERYVSTLLDAAEALGVERIVTLGGVYGELPYDKERPISAVYSLPEMKAETEDLAVTLSDYHGGASIGSMICKRAGERGMQHMGFYAFVPTYNFANSTQIGNTIQIENDFASWLGVMRRINFMLKTRFDLTEIEEKSIELKAALDEKIEQLASVAPQLNIQEYLAQLNEDFEEVTFNPLDDVWQNEIRRLFDGSESDSDESNS